MHPMMSIAMLSCRRNEKQKQIEDDNKTCRENFISASSTAGVWDNAYRSKRDLAYDLICLRTWLIWTRI
ncbi:hypothetical protein Pint_09820 [Pistacia integerrima]|uniref:Uncharacterized protein n=1 Tax=Pistacia integerrima TaxID=434235 RepID=A0ACC0XHK0_9ROSI|nr:hypothetical protein Pint_09820 [Pistacia integerrima]